MRALQVVPTYYPASVYGGPMFSIHYMALALAQNGVDIRVSTTNANRDDRLDVDTATETLLAENYAVHYYHELILDKFSWQFARNIGADVAKADVIHLHDIFRVHALQTMWECRRRNKPVVIAPRGVFSPWALDTSRAGVKTFWINTLVKPLVQPRPGLIWHATSEEEAGHIRAIFTDAEIAVIPNAVDLSQFDEVETPARTQWLKDFGPEGFEKDGAFQGLILVSMGRIHPVKGYDIALNALALAKAQGLDFIYCIAGRDEGAADDLIAQAKSLGLCDRFHIVGEVLDDSKIAFLKGADLFLFPSRSENFGMACLEGMAAGLPVIASQDTPWQSIEDNGAGLWVENTPTVLADALMQLAEMDRVSMSHHAVDLAAQFGLPVLANRIADVYQRQMSSIRTP